MSTKQITSNSSVTTTLLEKFSVEMVCAWKISVCIFTSNLVEFLNDFILSKSIWLTEDDNTTVGKDNYKQGFDSSGEVKQNNSIDYNNNVVSNEKVIGKDSDFLRNLRMKNVNRQIIRNLNIYSISDKFD